PASKVQRAPEGAPAPGTVPASQKGESLADDRRGNGAKLAGVGLPLPGPSLRAVRGVVPRKSERAGHHELWADFGPFQQKWRRIAAAVRGTGNPPGDFAGRRLERDQLRRTILIVRQDDPVFHDDRRM